MSSRRVIDRCGRTLIYVLAVLAVTVAASSAAKSDDWTVDNMCEIQANRQMICVDPVTSNRFEYIIYSGGHSQIEDVFEIKEPGVKYLQAAYGTSDIGEARAKIELEKRMNWVNCQENDGYLQWAACETTHIVAQNWASLGWGALLTVINQYITFAFTNGRDNQYPRSTCHNYDGQQLCVSWAVYSPHGMYSGELTDVSEFMANFVYKKMSGETKVLLISGTQQTICTSDRADGCTMSPSSC
ncbi:hypothetical protein V1525DRAFT_412141 [Lipomyces kononenkoae]|uniref:Uncharacterized protein n=1 Tax=Lipomyces kononenkoae TaxID=34357 RepID=A0ACC3SSZ6_LIPKO